MNIQHYLTARDIALEKGWIMTQPFIDNGRWVCGVTKDNLTYEYEHETCDRAIQGCLNYISS